jgi:4'-phosphopantetheinyl transferase EntD
MAGDVALVDLFDWDLPIGRCIGVLMQYEQSECVSLDSRVPLVVDEWAFADQLAPRRRRSWVAGRAAMRIALAREGIEAPAVDHDDRGAPVLPPGWSGSISHKEVQRTGETLGGAACERGDVVAVALAGREAMARLGVDVEFDRAPSMDIASHVLRQDEDAALAEMETPARAREVVLRFSAKEALFKALDPFVRRHVGFNEVAVTPHRDGFAGVVWHLASERDEGSFASDVIWRRTTGLVVTMARVRRRP